MTHVNETIADLTALNKLLLLERVAITRQQVQRLMQIQVRKAEIVEKLGAVELIKDENITGLIKAIQKNSRRNSFLIESGKKIFSGLQRNLVKKTAFGYGKNGAAAPTAMTPKLLSRSV